MRLSGTEARELSFTTFHARSSTFARWMKRRWEPGKRKEGQGEGEERTEIESIEDASLWILRWLVPRRVYSKTRNLIVRASSISHIFGRFPYNSLIFFFFCIFSLLLIYPQDPQTHVRIPELSLTYVEFLLKYLYVIDTLRATRKKGQTPTILVRMNVCLIGQDTRISHCRCICICMCMCVGYIYVNSSFLTLITSWLKS